MRSTVVRSTSAAVKLALEDAHERVEARFDPRLQRVHVVAFGALVRGGSIELSAPNIQDTRWARSAGSCGIRAGLPSAM
jgi:hypothetical protein